MNRRLILIYGLVTMLLITTCFSLSPAAPRLQAESVHGVDIASAQLLPVIDSSVILYPAGPSTTASALSTGQVLSRDRFLKAMDNTDRGREVRAFLNGRHIRFSQSAYTSSMAAINWRTFTRRIRCTCYGLGLPDRILSRLPVPHICNSGTSCRISYYTGHQFYPGQGRLNIRTRFSSDGKTPVWRESPCDTNCPIREYAEMCNSGGRQLLLDHLYPISFSVCVRSDNYIEQYYPGPVQVKVGVDTGNIDFILETGGALAGHVYQADGFTPIAGAFVVANLEDGNHDNSDKTSPEGAF